MGLGLEQVQRHVRTQQYGRFFFTIVAFLRLLDEGNKANTRPGVQSSVLITASVSGLMRSLVSGTAYMSSKAAALHMAKVLATYFGPHGIRINALAPGIFPSMFLSFHS